MNIVRLNLEKCYDECPDEGLDACFAKCDAVEEKRIEEEAAAEQKRLEEEEAERKRREEEAAAAAAEQKRLEEEEAERKRLEAEAEQKRLEEEKKRREEEIKNDNFPACARKCNHLYFLEQTLTEDDLRKRKKEGKESYMVCYAKCSLKASDKIEISDEDVKIMCAPNCADGAWETSKLYESEKDCMDKCAIKERSKSVMAEICQLEVDNTPVVPPEMQERCKENVMAAQALATELDIIEGGNALINHCAPCMITEMGDFKGDMCKKNNAFLSDEHKNKGELGITFEQMIAKSNIKQSVPTCKSLICTLINMPQCDEWRESAEGKNWCDTYGGLLPENMNPC